MQLSLVQNLPPYLLQEDSVRMVTRDPASSMGAADSNEPGTEVCIGLRNGDIAPEPRLGQQSPDSSSDLMSPSSDLMSPSKGLSRPKGAVAESVASKWMVMETSEGPNNRCELCSEKFNSISRCVPNLMFELIIIMPMTISES